MMKPYIYHVSHNSIQITSGAAEYKSKKEALKSIKRVMIHRGLKGNFEVWVFPMKKAHMKFEVVSNASVPVGEQGVA